MNSKSYRWINILSIILALLAMGQLLFTTTLLCLMNLVLTKAGGFFSSICGIIGSLVSLPTAFKIRSFYSIKEIRSYHMEMQNYHEFLLYVSLGIQVIAVIFCFVSLVKVIFAEAVLNNSIENYLQRYSDKKFVDMIQIMFQCCGLYNYGDWSKKEWIPKTEFVFPGRLRRTDNTKYENSTEKNSFLMNKGIVYSVNVPSAVPFSCCKIQIGKPCKNYDLQSYGCDTINTSGCSQKYINFLLSVIFSEIILYVLIILVTAYILRLMKQENNDTNKCDEFHKLYSQEDFSKYDDEQESWGNLKSQMPSENRFDSNSVKLESFCQEQLVIIPKQQVCLKNAKYLYEEESPLLHDIPTDDNTEKGCNGKCKRRSYIIPQQKTRFDILDNIKVDENIKNQTNKNENIHDTSKSKKSKKKDSKDKLERNFSKKHLYSSSNEASITELNKPKEYHSLSSEEKLENYSNKHQHTRESQVNIQTPSDKNIKMCSSNFCKSSSSNSSLKKENQPTRSSQTKNTSVTYKISELYADSSSQKQKKYLNKSKSDNFRANE